MASCPVVEPFLLRIPASAPCFSRACTASAPRVRTARCNGVSPVHIRRVRIPARLDQGHDGRHLRRRVPPLRTMAGKRCRMQRFPAPPILRPHISSCAQQPVRHGAAIRRRGKMERGIASKTRGGQCRECIDQPGKQRLIIGHNRVHNPAQIPIQVPLFPITSYETSTLLNVQPIAFNRPFVPHNPHPGNIRNHALTILHPERLH